MIFYAWGSLFDLAARGMTPSFLFISNSAATGYVNVTESFITSGTHFVNSTRLTIVLGAGEVQDQ